MNMRIVVPVEMLGERAEAFEKVEPLDSGYHAHYLVEGPDGKKKETIGPALDGRPLYIRQSTIDRVNKLFEMAGVILTAERPLLNPGEENDWRNLLGGRLAMVTNNGGTIYQNGRHGVDRKTYLDAIAANQLQVPRVYDTMKLDEAWARSANGEEPGEKLMADALTYLGADPVKDSIAEVGRDVETSRSGDPAIDQILDYVITILKSRTE